MNYVSSAGGAAGETIGPMNARFQHPSAGYGTPAPESVPAGAASAGRDGMPGRACCCAARAAVRVTMPPSPARPHPTDLFLCGHHYLLSRRALARAGARVGELPGTPPAVASWIATGADVAATAAR